MPIPAPGDALRAVLERARARGFLGPSPVDEHLVHASGFAKAIEETGGTPAHAVDLGSGGGIPGLVLAFAWAGCSWILVEVMAKRAAFLRDAVGTLGLAQRVDVVQERAETLGRGTVWRAQAPVVVARGFGPPAVTAECAAPLLQLNGRLVVSEPPAGEIGGRWDEAGLRQLGLGLGQQVRTGGATYQVLVQEVECPDRYPRRVGIPAKRPLF